MFWVDRLLVWLFGNRPRLGPGNLSAYTSNIRQFPQKENGTNLRVDNQRGYPCFRGIWGESSEFRVMSFESDYIKRGTDVI